MNLKTLSIVISVLAAVSIAVFVANRPSEPSTKDPRVGAPIVELGSLEKASKIQISDQGKTVFLAKQTDGSWQVLSYYGFPVDFSKLTQFVEELQKSRVDRFVTANAERIARFEFKDAKIALLDNADKELWTVTLGKNADGGGRLLRFGNESKAYLSRFNAWLDPESKNWADSSLLSFKPEDIAQIEISFPDAETVVVKRAKKEEAFVAVKMPAGSTLKAEKINGIMSTLSSLRFTDTTAVDDPKAQEAGKISRTIRLTTFDGRKLNVSLGRKPEQKIIKAPDAVKDGKATGPTAILGKTGAEALGISTAKKDESPEAPTKQEGPAKAMEPVTETIPAGPVFVSIKDSDAKSPVNALMQKRAFQVFEYSYTGLPQKPDELFQTAQPVAAPAPKTP